MLFVVVIEDSRSVLSASITALAVLSCGVVHFVEELQKRSVGDGGGVKGYLERLGVCITLRVSCCDLQESEVKIKNRTKKNYHVRPVLPLQTAR